MILSQSGVKVNFRVSRNLRASRALEHGFEFELRVFWIHSAVLDPAPASSWQILLICLGVF